MGDTDLPGIVRAAGGCCAPSKDAGCIAGALTEAEYQDALTRNGRTVSDIWYTHAVHEKAQAAIVWAVRA